MDSPFLQRDQAEIERSAAEANKVVLRPISETELNRYLNPKPNTAFPLEYAFYLLGDLCGKTVLDLGCGHGENIVVLAKRGARVIGIDISPELIAIARQRLLKSGLEASVSIGSAYETGLPDESVDIIFCAALIHHLDIKLAVDEMRRILTPDGIVVLKEPIRFSKTYAWLRGLLPAQDEISEFEHPLTREELDTVTRAFAVEGLRYFRLPLVPLIDRALPSKAPAAWKASDWILRHFQLHRYATTVVTKLQKNNPKSPTIGKIMLDS